MQEVSFGLGEIETGREGMGAESANEGFTTVRMNEFGRSVRRRLSADVVCPWVINEEEEPEDGGYPGGGERSPLLPTGRPHSDSVHSGSTKSPNSPEGVWFLTTPAHSPSRLQSPPCTPAFSRGGYSPSPINRLGSDASWKGKAPSPGPGSAQHTHPLSSETSGNETEHTEKSGAGAGAGPDGLQELESKVEALFEQARRIEHKFSVLVEECLLELSRIENVPVPFLREMHRDRDRDRNGDRDREIQKRKEKEKETPTSLPEKQAATDIHRQNELGRERPETHQEVRSKDRTDDEHFV